LIILFPWDSFEVSEIKQEVTMEMDSFKHTNVGEALMMQEEQSAVILDIRDPQSFAASHATGSKHLTNDTIVSLLDDIELDQPILVMCYHGVSSQGAAQYIVNQGYENVFSIDGGFEAWHRANQPVEGFNN
jgi:thiosulfate sulfurtransferase